MHFPSLTWSSLIILSFWDYIHIGIPNSQVQNMKKVFPGSMTRGFRGAMSRAGYLSSKAGYGSLYGANEWGNSRKIIFMRVNFFSKCLFWPIDSRHAAANEFHTVFNPANVHDAFPTKWSEYGRP